MRVLCRGYEAWHCLEKWIMGLNCFSRCQCTYKYYCTLVKRVQAYVLGIVHWVKESWLCVRVSVFCLKLCFYKTFSRLKHLVVFL
jgi:hypothetical protein